MQVANYDMWQYRSVWLITEMRDGCAYKTKDTGKFIRAEDEAKIDLKKYLLSSASTTLIRNPVCEIELFDLEIAHG